jgi:hypothetical protein
LVSARGKGSGSGYFYGASSRAGAVLSTAERERGGGGFGNNIFGLKVPRHCPLVLIGVKLEFRINSTFFLFILILVELEGLHWNEI